MIKKTNNLEGYLNALVDELSVPEERYAQASRSYKSFGEWLHRPESTLLSFDPDVYLQGSFKLGTVIRPHGKDDDYDVDAVCLFNDLQKGQLTQQRLKTLFKTEVDSYHKKEAMVKPVEEKNRCWRLSYADGAQFHMDLLPAIPNGKDVRKMLEAKQLDVKFVDTAIAITCTESQSYKQLSHDWPRSNPKGYAEWFKDRMGDIFNERRVALLEKKRKTIAKASIEDIPEYEVRTPLQSVIMILKHHRDTMFADDKDEKKPISIILTTLSAHAYNGERDIVSALSTILTDMKNAIEHDGTKYIIANPTDKLENFADKWETYPERAKAFFDWLETAQRDFLGIMKMTDRLLINEHVSKGLGRDLTGRALAKATASATAAGGLLAPATAAAAAPALSFGNQRREPTGPKDFA